MTDRAGLDRPLRILMLSDLYPPLITGEGHYVRNLSRALAERGHQVSVATLAQPGLAAAEHDRGVQVWRLRGTLQRAAWLFKDPSRKLASPGPDPEIVWGLRRLLQRERPEIVHAHAWLARSFLPLKPWSGARLVMTLHSYGLVCAKRTLMHRAAPCSGPELGKCADCLAGEVGTLKGLAMLGANWTTGVAERAAVDLYLPISQAVAQANRLAEDRLPFQVVNSFLADEQFAEQAEDLTAYLTQLPPEGFLLFVGAFLPDKGVEVLLQAYASLETAPPLVLIGPLWPPPPRNLPSNVTVLRDWPHRAVMAAWRRSLLALVPSVWIEPASLAAIEASVAGRAVIASRIGGLVDIVVDGETGLLVPPGDAASLAAAIQRLLDDPDLRTRLGQAGRQRAERFRASAVVPRIEQLYRQLLDRRRPVQSGQA